jgi:hypothetical protein
MKKGVDTGEKMGMTMVTGGGFVQLTPVSGSSSVQVALE